MALEYCTLFPTMYKRVQPEEAGAAVSVGGGGGRWSPRPSEECAGSTKKLVFFLPLGADEKGRMPEGTKEGKGKLLLSGKHRKSRSQGQRRLSGRPFNEGGKPGENGRRGFVGNGRGRLQPPQ